ncbi:hypothetical protein M9H77_23278 [Catharanthus roseus]|uniref:Uncharacterized protein n=1 Tax=Catharanthus roseus TaxID=4058 RepID=A0ACC0ASV1_CATRO|nr:hypothetical protein M9H77_23278 [Catharanthus roseus]
MISERPLGASPCNTEKNTREYAKAVTLKSGKELVEIPPMVVDKEKENVQVPEESTSVKEDEIIQGNNLTVKMAKYGRKGTLPPTVALPLPLSVGFYRAKLGNSHTYR